LRGLLSVQKPHDVARGSCPHEHAEKLRHANEDFFDEAKARVGRGGDVDLVGVQRAEWLPHVYSTLA
jgi:hypothetical protein